ncbi:MAG: LacI family DNA-binding transcriptional regulator [Actinomycetota bacterium]|jgi:LacI family transcriptional regulator|nr:LacI family DNA-binding transcriptional regulator [Actinomycetota bacterium]
MVDSKKRKSVATSIKDIASEAGVAISTVSNVINETRFVAETTKLKVLDAIEKLNYRPNIIARGLRIKSTRAIGVILPDISSSFFSQVIYGIEEVARKKNYTMILGCTNFDFREEIKIANKLIDSFIDGLIFFSGFDNYEFIKKIYDRNIPIVVVDKELGDKEIPTVVIDNASAVENCVDYLCRYNHKKICYVSFTEDYQTTVRQRYEGYLAGLKKNNIDFDPDFVLMSEEMRLHETASGYCLVKEFLKKGKLPTAFLTAADVFAYGILRALHEEGFKVPDDISVMGFDNILFSQFTKPLLTTLKQPKKLMGNIAMDLLVNIIEGKEVKEKNIILPTSIIERESVTFAKDI